MLSITGKQGRGKSSFNLLSLFELEGIGDVFKKVYTRRGSEILKGYLSEPLGTRKISLQGFSK